MPKEVYNYPQVVKPPPNTSGTGAESYQDGTDIPNVRGPIQNLHPFTAPPVPGGEGGSKGTSVDTPSLAVFADNIDKLITPLKSAQERLATVAVAPGAFYHANVMRTQVNGPNSDSGLKKSYIDALSALITGLTDTRDGARKLSHDYQAGEDGNSMSAKKLAEAFGNAPGDFDRMMTANGGSGSSPGGSGSSGSGSGGSSSGGSGSGGSSSGNTSTK